MTIIELQWETENTMKKCPEAGGIMPNSMSKAYKLVVLEFLLDKDLIRKVWELEAHPCKI